MSLRQHGEIVICNLGYGISPFIDFMADLVGNSPAEVLTAFISAFRIRLHRNAPGKPRYGPPFDSDMKSSRIHERACKHSLIAQIQPAHRQFVLLTRIGITAQSLMLIEKIHHLISRRQGLIQLLRLFLHSSA